MHVDNSLSPPSENNRMTSKKENKWSGTFNEIGKTADKELPQFEKALSSVRSATMSLCGQFFEVRCMNGERFQVDGTDIVTALDLKSRLRSSYAGDLVTRRVLTIQLLEDGRVIQDHEDLKDLCIHGEPGVCRLWEKYA